MATHPDAIRHITVMHQLIDRSITPDPFNPQPGDVYARSHAGRAGHREGDGIPRRVVVHDIHEGAVRCIVDGGPLFACKAPDVFRRYLASIDGLEAIGRVRSETRL
jgi:hypothetical protein